MWIHRPVSRRPPSAPIRGVRSHNPGGARDACSWDACRACAIGCVLIAAVAPAQAETVADFYRGKSIRMLIGYGPGGGYDIYGRLVAEFLPRHLSGNPTIVPQNMPGAGSFVAQSTWPKSRPGTVRCSAACRRCWHSTA